APIMAMMKPPRLKLWIDPPMPISGAITALPMIAPIIPTTMFQKIPIEPSRAMTMLASQPAIPPTIIAIIQPILRSSCYPRAQALCRDKPQPGECVPRGAAAKGGIGGKGDARGRRGSILELALVEIAVVLDARHPQALHAGTIDRPLPRGKFLERQVVALEHF